MFFPLSLIHRESVDLREFDYSFTHICFWDHLKGKSQVSGGNSPRVCRLCWLWPILCMSHTVSCPSVWERRIAPMFPLVCRSINVCHTLAIFYLFFDAPYTFICKEINLHQTDLLMGFYVISHHSQLMFHFSTTHLWFVLQSLRRDCSIITLCLLSCKGFIIITTNPCSVRTSEVFLFFTSSTGQNCN